MLLHSYSYLAAISSSRRDFVAQFVCSLLCLSPFFSLLVSLESVVHLECRKASKNPFNGVSRKFKGCFKEVLRVFIECFKGVSRKFQGCFKEVARVLKKS